MKKPLLFFLAILNVILANAQYFKQQYFDGKDTNASNSIIIKLDTTLPNNIWQIGRPQKAIFDSAATLPNALVTDTIHYYPDTNISRFQFQFGIVVNWGIAKLQWKQKLDFDKKKDGGIIEYSQDTGNTWHNVFNNPYIYNFYGFDSLKNKDTLITGEYAFSGTDTNWKDIWLCFANSYFFGKDLRLRFTLKSDSINNSKEGWMIDNMVLQNTITHTVKEMDQSQYLRIYPTPSTGIVHVEAQKLNQYHIIKSMQLTDISGRIVEQYGESPTKFWIDISNHPDGQYFLKITTNLKSETLPVILKR